MNLLVEVVVEGLDRPPVGAPVRVEVRDTTYEDVEAPLVASARAEVGEAPAQTVAVEIPDSALDARGRLTAFVHVDVDADGALSHGDFITTQSYPVPRDGTLHVAVQRI